LILKNGSVVAYIKETGDFSILEAVVPYFDGGQATVLDHMILSVRYLSEETGDQDLVLAHGSVFCSLLDVRCWILDILCVLHWILGIEKTVCSTQKSKLSLFIRLYSEQLVEKPASQ